jgi:hypothetical protein
MTAIAAGPAIARTRAGDTRVAGNQAAETATTATAAVGSGPTIAAIATVECAQLTVDEADAGRVNHQKADRSSATATTGPSTATATTAATRAAAATGRAT